MDVLNSSSPHSYPTLTPTLTLTLTLTLTQTQIQSLTPTLTLNPNPSPYQNSNANSDLNPNPNPDPNPNRNPNSNSWPPTLHPNPKPSFWLIILPTLPKLKAFSDVEVEVEARERESDGGSRFGFRLGTVRAWDGVVLVSVGVRVIGIRERESRKNRREDKSWTMIRWDGRLILETERRLDNWKSREPLSETHFLFVNGDISTGVTFKLDLDWRNQQH